LARAQTEATDVRLAERVAVCPAALALTSIPEVSALCAATIVAELGTPEGYESPRQILKLAGMNLVVNASATRLGRARHSKRGRPMLRKQLFLLAGRWCQARGLYRTQYLALKAAGQSRTSAMCAIARKLVPMLYSVMQSGRPFDVVRWCAAHGVPVPPPTPTPNERRQRRRREQAALAQAA
jgi:transposase